MSGDNFDRVRFEDNRSEGPVRIFATNEIYFDRNEVDCTGRTSAQPAVYLLTANADKNPIAVRGNFVRAAQLAGIRVGGNADAGTLIMDGNTVFEFDLAASGTAASDSGIIVQNFGTAFLSNNRGLLGTSVTALNEFYLTDTADGMDVVMIGNYGEVTVNGSVNTISSLGVDSGNNLTMSQLPTSTPGGSGRVWANSNVVTIT